MFDTLDISSSALQAQRIRLDAIAQNIANANVTHNTRGENVPFRRRIAIFTAGRAGDPAKPGVSVTIKQDPAFRQVFEPGRGYIKHPSIEPAVEMINALEASRAYEANVTTMEVTKAMMNASLRLLA